MTDPELRAAIAAKLDEAERALADIRALLAPAKGEHVDRAILRALSELRQPLTMAQFVDVTGQDFNTVGLALTRMYRAGTLTRERISRDGTKRKYYAYRLIPTDA